MSTNRAVRAPQIEARPVGRVRSGLGRNRVRRTIAAVAAAATLTIVPAAVGAPAQAASSIVGPGGLGCTSNAVSFSTPRVWASYKTEQVTMAVGLARWSGTAWYSYSSTLLASSVNTFGFAVTAWPYQVNNRISIGVRHTGYYRVAAVINGSQGGQTWAGWIDGGAYCYVG